MNVKYYSDLIPGKAFESEEECLKAEEEVKNANVDEPEKEEEECVATDEKEVTTESKSKKECAKAIEDAKIYVQEAKNEYHEALNKANLIYDQAREEISKLKADYEARIAEIRKRANEEAYKQVSVQAERVREAEENYREKMLDYCDTYGVYKTYYTGRDAEKEFVKMQKELNKSFDIIFGNRQRVFDTEFWKIFF